MPEIVYLSLGSNLGNRHDNLRHAITRLAHAGDVQCVSSFYETQPVDVTDQPDFLNCVVALQTTMMPRELLGFVLSIEQSMGRQRARDKGPRIIDVDILFFGDRTIVEPGLTIPHPALQQRRFVLEPLAEIAPDVVHPVLKKAAREMLSELPPGQVVSRWPDTEEITKPRAGNPEPKA